MLCRLDIVLLSCHRVVFGDMVLYTLLILCDIDVLLVQYIGVGYDVVARGGGVGGCNT